MNGLPGKRGIEDDEKGFSQSQIYARQDQEKEQNNIPPDPYGIQRHGSGEFQCDQGG
jgi:hypothetical protein